MYINYKALYKIVDFVFKLQQADAVQQCTSRQSQMLEMNPTPFRIL